MFVPLQTSSTLRDFFKFLKKIRILIWTLTFKIWLTSPHPMMCLLIICNQIC